ncbi:MAG: hypothetical protein QM785_00815 [Pyrinomonadaceae bacterium]
MESLDRHCEKFMGGPSVAYSERLHATIDARGKIFVNGKLHQMMGSPEAVCLYFNRPRNMIILEPADNLSSTDAFRLKPQTHGGSRVLYANPFCKHFGIRIPTTERFIHPTTDATGRLYLKLTETVTISRTQKRRKSFN